MFSWSHSLDILQSVKTVGFTRNEQLKGGGGSGSHGAKRVGEVVALGQRGWGRGGLGAVWNELNSNSHSNFILVEAFLIDLFLFPLFWEESGQKFPMSGAGKPGNTSSLYPAGATAPPFPKLWWSQIPLDIAPRLSALQRPHFCHRLQLPCLLSEKRAVQGCILFQSFSFVPGQYSKQTVHTLLQWVFRNYFLPLQPEQC